MAQFVQVPVAETSTRSTLWRPAVAVLPIAIGFVLVCAALVKVHYPADIAMLRSSYRPPILLVVIVTQAELALGVLLLSGRQPQVARFAGMGMFAVFTAFSLYRALAGYESCGCFGPLSVNPWWTTLFDAAVVIALAPCPVRRSSPIRVNRTRTAAFLGVWVILSSVVTLQTLRTGMPRLSTEEALLDDDGLIILEPETWIGKELSLQDYLTPKIDVSREDWIIVLYHHDCPKCREALPKYEALAGRLKSRGATAQVLLIEIPPYEEYNFVHLGPARQARLSAQHEWFVQTPVEILLADGKIQSASLDLPSLAEAQ